MGKKKKHPEHVNLERWLISYADFITLLFAFFVVMFASAYTGDTKKPQRTLAEAVSTYFNTGVFEQGGSQMVGSKMFARNQGVIMHEDGGEGNDLGPNRGEISRPKDMSTNSDEKYEPTSMIRDQLTQEYFNDLKKQNLTVTMESRGLVVNFTGAAFFDEGSVTMTPKSKELLKKIVKAIKARKNFIQIEGHSDGTAADKGGYDSTMDISSRRAEAIAKILIQEFGLPAEYIATTGYGPFRPIRDNKTSSGRSENRRVDIVLLKTTPDEKHIALPKPGAAPETEKTADSSLSPE